MNVKLLVTLMTCVMVVSSHSTISAGDSVQCEALRSDMESIRQLLMTQQQASEEMKSQIEEIRDVVIQLQNPPRRDVTYEGCPPEFDYLPEADVTYDGCPPGFEYQPEVGSCYKLIFEKMPWENATERCRQVMPGVYLATITSREENNAIVRYLRSQFRMGSSGCISSRYPSAGSVIWIGGQTRNSSRCGDPYVWKSLRGIEIPFNYTNWGPGDPDCYESAEHCAQIVTGRDYMWNDGDCDSLSCPICELHV